MSLYKSWKLFGWVPVREYGDAVLLFWIWCTALHSAVCTWIHISSKIHFLAKPLHSTPIRLNYCINVPKMRDIVNFAAGNLHNCVFPFRQSRGPLKISQEMPVGDISRGQDFLTPIVSRVCFHQRGLDNMCGNNLEILKGTVPRDFRLKVFYMDQLPPSP